MKEDRGMRKKLLHRLFDDGKRICKEAFIVLFRVLSQRLPGRTKEIHERVVRIAGPSTGIRPWELPNAKQKYKPLN